MNLKSFLFFIIVLFSTSSLFSQNNWKTNYEKAMAQAKIEKKAVLLLFTGSDWCPPCKSLHRNIFDSKVFEEYAKEHLILIKADFPRHRKNQLPIELKKHNEQLAVKYEIKGFPTVLILNPDGEVLNKSVGYRGNSPKSYIDNISKKTKALLLAKSR